MTADLNALRIYSLPDKPLPRQHGYRLLSSKSTVYRDAPMICSDFTRRVLRDDIFLDEEIEAATEYTEPTWLYLTPNTDRDLETEEEPAPYDGIPFNEWLNPEWVDPATVALSL